VKKEPEVPAFMQDKVLEKAFDYGIAGPTFLQDTESSQAVTMDRFPVQDDVSEYTQIGSQPHKESTKFTVLEPPQISQ